MNMKEGESKKAALILMKNSPFDRTLRYRVIRRVAYFEKNFAKTFSNFMN